MVCCSWQAAESLDGDDEDEEGDGNGGGGCCWPSGAQPLGRVTFTADDLLPSSPEEGGGGEDEHDEVEEGLWCVEATSPEEVVGGDDLPSLCAALHRRLTRGEAAVQPGPATRRALRRGLARLVGGLKEELDLLCALVEGTAADPALVRRVWLAQPAQAAAVYLLRLLVAGAEGEEGGRLMYDTLL